MDRISVYLLSPAADRRNFKAEWIDQQTGRRRSRSTGTDDPGAAERFRSDLEYELNHGLSRPGRSLAWPAFRTRYEEERVSEMEERTREMVGGILNRIERTLQPATISSLDARAVSRYAAGLRRDGAVAATVVGHLGRIKAMLRWAARQGLIASCPNIDLPKVPRRRRIRTLPEVDLPRLLEVMPDDTWRLLALLAWHAGLRRAELLALHWEEREKEPWVDLDARRIWFPIGSQKADREDWVPIHRDLLAELEAVRQPAGLVVPLGVRPDWLSTRFAELATSAGLNITLHDLRRSFGTRYAPKVPAQVLQRLMRHSDIKTTMEYYVDLDGAVASAIDLV